MIRMSLPIKYDNFSDYIKETVDFLCNYQWLYSVPNTHILTNGLLDNFSIEWQNILIDLTTEELNNIPNGYINANWPESLQRFITKINSLKPYVNYAIQKHDFKLPNQFFKGLNQKKRHEIEAFAPFINETCKLFKCDIIIDIGAGLGYLPQLLYKLYDFEILAIEADEKKVETAKKRQIELYNDSINHVKYIHHFVNEGSSMFLQKIIEENNFAGKNVCLIGLHACADLTITLFKLFADISFVKQAIVMPCCYHRLRKLSNPHGELTTDNSNSGEFFANFPVSYSLWNLYDNRKANKFLTGAFLRLACQNTAACWRSMSQEDHKIHSIGAMRRAVLQLVAERERYTLRRIKRKTNSEPDFEMYLSNLENSHSVTNKNNEEMINSKVFKDKFTAAWRVYEQDCQLLEAYTALQTSLQNICENIILLDRVEMLKEWGFESYARKITDDFVSPRCYAIVARKPADVQTIDCL